MEVLHIADPHVDFEPKTTKKQISESIQNGGIDMVVCTGDISNSEMHTESFFSWFDKLDVPKYVVMGNHDYWAFRDPMDFKRLAEDHGWKTMNPENHWEVVDDVLMFNMIYTPWPGIPADPYYTNDHHFFDISKRFLLLKDVQMPPDGVSKVRFSMGHMSPSERIPSDFTPKLMYVNPLMLDVAKVYRSPVHFYGHVHENGDNVIDGIRCVSVTTKDRRYINTKELRRVVADIQLVSSGGAK